MSENKKGKSARHSLQWLLRALKHLFLHNGPLKLIAILISLALWAGLVSQDESITRDKTFQNVSVTVTGTEALKNKGYIVVTDLDELLSSVSMVAAVPQKQYDNAEASAYSVKLDLSKINGTGEQELKLQSTSSVTYGRVTSFSPATIKVNVEKHMERNRIPVSASIDGEIPEGWYMSSPSVDPSLVSVSGPSALVQTISRARVFINTEDIEWKESTIVTSAGIKLYNRSGEEVNSPLLTINNSSLTIDSVLIEMNILPCETFETIDLVQITGTVMDGYNIKNVSTSPDTITVAARQEVLEQMTDLLLERYTVNVDNLSETNVFQLKVQKPSEDAILSNDTVSVTVEIEADQT